MQDPANLGGEHEPVMPHSCRQTQAHSGTLSYESRI